MNLYHVKQTINNDYDTYSDFVIAANTEEEARNTHPSGNQACWDGTYAGSWVSIRDRHQLVVTHIGKARPGITGIICRSFHAG